MEQEFDFLEIVKRIRVLGMITSALFAKRQAIFVGYADRFLIKVDKNGELIQTNKSADAFSVE